MNNFSALSYLFILIVLVNISNALECYVCDNQEDNNGKCVATIKTCDYEEDVCLSEIKWGSTPYWQQGALKQYYVSKRCSSQEKCSKYRSNNMPLCTHIWYQDWKCSECCKGDRCNYYIISGSASLKGYTFMMISTTILSFIFMSM